MIKHFKTFALSAGLTATLLFGLVGHAQAAKTKEAAAAPAAVEAAPQASAAAVVAPIAAAPAAADPHAGEENPYGLKALWGQGDIVAKGTLLILVLMSMGSWYVLITKFFEQNKVARFAKQAQDNFWSASNVRQGTDALDEASPFRFIAEKGLEGASKHTGMLGAINFNDWVTMSIQRAINNVQSRMQDGLALLATNQNYSFTASNSVSSITASIGDAVDKPNKLNPCLRKRLSQIVNQIFCSF